MRKARIACLFLILLLGGCTMAAKDEQKETKSSGGHAYYVQKLQDFPDQDEKFDEASYEDLCKRALLYSGRAVMKKDMNNDDYIEDAKKALEYYSKAVDRDSELTTAYKGLFSVYRFLGDEKNALRSLKQAVDKNNDDFDAVFMLGNFYYEKRDFGNALDWLEKAQNLAEADQSLLDDKSRSGLEKMINEARQNSSGKK